MRTVSAALTIWGHATTQPTETLSDLKKYFKWEELNIRGPSVGMGVPLGGSLDGFHSPEFMIDHVVFWMSGEQTDLA